MTLVNDPMMSGLSVSTGLGHLPMHGQDWGGSDHATPSGSVGAGAVGIPAELLEWATRHGASSETVAVLLANGFINIRLVNHLTPTDIDKLDLPLAQKLAVREAVRDTRHPKFPEHSNSNAITGVSAGGVTHTSSGTSLDHAVAQLWGGQAGATTEEPKMDSQVLQGLETLGLAKNASTVDHESPLVYLAKPKGLKKYHDIADFLSDSVTGEEQSLGTQDGVELLLKPTQSKGKLDKVTQAQWCMANTRILAELLSSGQLHQCHLADYLAYTVKVCQLTERYTWGSILQFDRDFRQKQALTHCRWGSDIGHLRSVFLVEKTPYQSTFSKDRPGLGSKQTPQVQNRRAPGNQSQNREEKKDREVCRLFNQGKCNFPNCRYKHECLIPGCQKTHTVYEHFGPTHGEPRAPQNTQ